MNECSVEECEREEVDTRGLCQHHLRRWLDGLVFEEPDDFRLFDHCLKGHVLAGDNIRWESTGNKGKKRRRCRECLRLKAKNQSLKVAAVVETPQPIEPQNVTYERAMSDWNDALEDVDAKCKDKPAEYVDWEQPPTVQRALELCEGCPLKQACLNYAVATGQTHGIWGGRVFFDGELLPVRGDNSAA